MVIGSLPGVAQKTGPDAPACTLTVGVADGQSLEATWYELRSDGAPDPCERARAAAEAVVSNLPPLAR